MVLTSVIADLIVGVEAAGRVGLQSALVPVFPVLLVVKNVIRCGRVDVQERCPHLSGQTPNVPQDQGRNFRYSSLVGPARSPMKARKWVKCEEKSDFQ